MRYLYFRSIGRTYSSINVLAGNKYGSTTSSYSSSDSLTSSIIFAILNPVFPDVAVFAAKVVFWTGWSFLRVNYDKTDKAQQNYYKIFYRILTTSFRYSHSVSKFLEIF